VHPGDNRSMRFRVLACDFDCTLAMDGDLSAQTQAALRQVAATGRRLVMVTGRTREELVDVFGDLELFDAIVIENGAVLLDPITGAMRALAKPLPGSVAQLLRRRVTGRVVSGMVICATLSRNGEEVSRILQELGVDAETIYNRDSLMVLPRGVDKATGLTAALNELGEPFSATVAVGDGENDVPLIQMAEIGVAVGNAVDSLKQRADVVLEQPNGAGIRELCEALIASDLSELLPVGSRSR